MNLATLTALAQAATPGSRKQAAPQAMQWPAHSIYVDETGVEIARVCNESDQAFIAACDPQTILALVAKLREWEKEFEERGYAFQKAQNDTLLENRRLVARVRELEALSQVVQREAGYYDTSWLKDHAKNDHMNTMDHKDEMSLSESLLVIKAALTSSAEPVK